MTPFRAVKIGSNLRDNGDEEEAHEGTSWRDVHPTLRRSSPEGAEARFAIRSPGLWALARAFQGTRKQAEERLLAMAQIVKVAGQWEQSGGGATQGVYAMTPGALHIPGGGFGGPSTLNALVGMQMRPTLAGMQPMYGGGGEGLVNAYASMARGNPPIGW